MGDYTTVTLTIHTIDETKFLKGIQTIPDERKALDQPSLIELAFHEWNRPEVSDFLIRGIPFLGFHGRGDEFPPYRFCSDGVNTSESICDNEGRLLAPISRSEGRLTIPELRAIREYFSFEDSCRKLLESRLENAA